MKTRSHKNYLGIIPSGSFSKGTVVKGGKVDIDLLISLKNQTPYDLKEIYEWHI